MEHAATARRMWVLMEPIHDVVYFAPEPARSASDLGLRGFWMGYFAFRAAPLGAVTPATVTALFHGFPPAQVQRALPDAWAVASPIEILRARERASAAALRRICRRALADVDGLADLAWQAARGVLDAPGRPLGAANAAVRRPDDPVAALWQACTTLREHRGDGHVAALVAHGIGPVEAHLLKVAATPDTDLPLLRRARRWSEDQWQEAAQSLQARGWVLDGRLTEAGQALHTEVERVTDAAAAGPWATFGEVEQLAAALEPVTAAVLAGGEIPRGNPVGNPTG